MNPPTNDRTQQLRQEIANKELEHFIYSYKLGESQEKELRDIIVLLIAAEQQALLDRISKEVIGEDEPTERTTDYDFAICNSCEHVVGDPYDDNCPCDYHNQLRAEQRKALASLKAELEGGPE